MNNKSLTSLRAIAKQSSLWIAASAFGLLAMTTMGYAEEPSIYSPEYCEFSVTFPGEPYKTRRCEDGDENRCYEQISYTQVYELNTTVNIRVICNQIGSEVRSTYSGEVMEATLRAMTQDTVVKTYDTSFREEEHYKQAGLVGEGLTGRTPTIYIAQLWIGDQSALSVEAELIGEAHDKADKLFSDILKSVRYSVNDETEEEDTEKEAEEEPEKDD